MGVQLNIRSDKAHALATELAARKNMTLVQVVEAALENFKQQEAATQAERQARRVEAIQHLSELVKGNRAYIIATGGKTSSDHSELYDDDGLPI
jgi:hypothetical protein